MTALLGMLNVKIMGSALAQEFLFGAGWSAFRAKAEEYFRHGLGGDGAVGIGIAIAVIGIVCAVISFVVHKFNPQSRMPGWITCLIIGIAGAMLMGGVEKPIAYLTQVKDWIFDLLDI